MLRVVADWQVYLPFWKGTALWSRHLSARSVLSIVSLVPRGLNIHDGWMSADGKDINAPAQESTEGIIPEQSWPNQGSIQVENFSVRYGHDLPDVLHDVSFNVEVSPPFI